MSSTRNRNSLLLAAVALVLASAIAAGPAARPAAADDVQVDVSVFYDSLAPYGEWVTLEPYGSVWVPATTDWGWRPYTVGHWAWIDGWGWTWVSSEPYGWAPRPPEARWHLDVVEKARGKPVPRVLLKDASTVEAGKGKVEGGSVTLFRPRLVPSAKKPPARVHAPRAERKPLERDVTPPSEGDGARPPEPPGMTPPPPPHGGMGGGGMGGMGK